MVAAARESCRHLSLSAAAASEWYYAVLSFFCVAAASGFIFAVVRVCAGVSAFVWIVWLFGRSGFFTFGVPAMSDFPAIGCLCSSC